MGGAWGVRRRQLSARASLVFVASLLGTFSVLLLFAPLADAGRVIWDQSTNSITPNSRGIFVADAAGTGLKQLSFTSSPDTHGPPASTPDGKQIIYNERTSSTGANVLRIMDVDGKNNKPLSSDAFDAEFSPDGSKIVFTRILGGKHIIHTMNGDGTGATPTGVEGRTPTFSPDGKRIAYSADPGDGGGDEIFLMNADGSGSKRLSETTAGSPWIGSSHPSFSPDGLELVFAMSVQLSGLSQPPGTHLMTIDVPDPEPDPDDPDPVLTDLTAGQASTDEFDGQPSWSPDGNQIAFFSRRQGGATGIYVMKAVVGSPATPVHATPSLNTNPGINWVAEGGGSSSDDSAACKKAKKKLKKAKKKLKKAKKKLKKAKKSGASQGKLKKLKKQVKKAAKKHKKAKRDKRKKC